jgi:hypothetical protein
MYSSFDKILTGLLLLSIVSTTYLYTYPSLQACLFPGPQERELVGRWGTFKERLGLTSASPPTELPFRLLALGDPQLEGDSSLPNSDDGYFPSLQTILAAFRASSSGWELVAAIRCAVHDLVASDIPKLLYSYRKRLDLLGNDYYLAHIYRTVHWFTKPTHVAVLGDLLGSQWITDEEFERRGRRYWTRVFRHGRRIEDEVTGSTRREILGGDKRWETRIINIAGNHDIGYAGDITVKRLERFERVFGKANWEIRFTASTGLAAVDQHPSQVNETPELRIVVLNSLNLDTPALSHELQADTYKFINDVIGASRPVEDRSTLTLLLTHLPLHKPAGICADSPYFEFYPEKAHEKGVKEQNHLSEYASKGILEGIFGLSGNSDGPGRGFGRNGVILTGHDHEGCDVYHFLSENGTTISPLWEARPWDESGTYQNKSVRGIREITLRSMMGEFGGNAGLFSAWFDYDIWEWKTAYSTCPLGTQHKWWAVHVLDIITFGLFLARLLCKKVKLPRFRREQKNPILVNPDCPEATESKNEDTNARIGSHVKYVANPRMSPGAHSSRDVRRRKS